MTDPAEAFLSYTRLDDEFFGGAITSLRRLLELGVQVVTGDRTFNIFQDVEGIVSTMANDTRWCFGWLHGKAADASARPTLQPTTLWPAGAVITEKKGL